MRGSGGPHSGCLAIGDGNAYVVADSANNFSFRFMMILRRVTLCAFIWMFVPPTACLRAQVLQTDVISSYRGTDTAAFNALFQFNFSVEQQLNTVVNLSAGADFLLNTGDDALILASKAKVTYAGDLQVTNSGFGHLRYKRNRAEPTGVDLFTQYQWDGPRGMKNRFLLGGNLRHILTADSSGLVDVAAGLMYEYENWVYDGIAESERPPDQSPVSVSHPRINTYIRFSRNISNGFRILLMNYIQARTDSRIDEPRIATALQFDIAITGNLSLTVAYNSVYDFSPVVPIRHFYFDISNGIMLKI